MCDTFNVSTKEATSKVSKKDVKRRPKDVFRIFAPLSSFVVENVFVVEDVETTKDVESVTHAHARLS